MLDIADHGRVRVLTLARPEARNALNEALYDALTDALLDAVDDRRVAVVVITGSEGAFCAGTDVVELAERTAGRPVTGRHGFSGFADALIEFPKPLLMAVNGLALGIGATMLGFADLVFMADTARIRCPFTALGVAPEAASSVTFPQLMGRQRASWVLLSSEWIDAATCHDLGLVFATCAADELLDTTLAHAQVLASKPIDSLVESKRVIVEPLRPAMREARDREDEAFKLLLGGPANIEALRAFMEKREPDFSAIDSLDA